MLIAVLRRRGEGNAVVIEEITLCDVDPGQPEVDALQLRRHAPQRIAPGQRGEINLSYLIPADKPRYGTLRDALEVAVDGRSNGTTIVAHGIGVDPRPADATQKTPRAEFFGKYP